MKQRVLTIASDVLGTPIEQLDGASSPDTVESWDSLNHMNLVLALEEEFGVQFSDDQIVELLSIDAMVDALSAMSGASDGNAG